MNTNVEVRMVTEVDCDTSPEDMYSPDNYKGEENNPDYQKWLHEDAARIVDYYKDRWYYMGVRAQAKVTIPSGIKDGWMAEIIIKSPGLWGIESDCGDDYLKEIYQDEVDNLKIMIENLQKGEVEYTVDPSVFFS